jgi:hypothetical protein
MNVPNTLKPEAVSQFNPAMEDDDEMPPSLVVANDDELQQPVAAQTDVAMYPEDENIQKVPITIVTGNDRLASFLPARLN